MENFDIEAKVVKEGDNAENMMDLDGDNDNILNLKSLRYNCILQKIDDALQVRCDYRLLFEDDREYQLIVDCNALLEDIEDEIVIIQNFIRNIYSLKVPVFPYFLDDPVSYAQVVRKIGNKTRLYVADFEGLGLPPSLVETIIALLEFRSRHYDVYVSEDDMLKVYWACDLAIQLDSAREKLNLYIESRMPKFAPNLSSVVGSLIATKIICSAGSLSTLANMQPCQVQLLGSNKMVLDNKSGTMRSHICSVYYMDAEVFEGRSFRLKMRLSSFLAAKCIRAAQADFTRAEPTGKIGRTLYNEIIETIQEWEESDPSLMDDSANRLYEPINHENEVGPWGSRGMERDEMRMSNYFSQMYIN